MKELTYLASLTGLMLTLLGFVMALVQSFISRDKFLDMIMLRNNSLFVVTFIILIFSYAIDLLSLVSFSILGATYLLNINL